MGQPSPPYSVRGSRDDNIRPLVPSTPRFKNLGHPADRLPKCATACENHGHCRTCRQHCLPGSFAVRNNRKQCLRCSKSLVLDGKQWHTRRGHPIRPFTPRIPRAWVENRCPVGDIVVEGPDMLPIAAVSVPWCVSTHPTILPELPSGGAADWMAHGWVVSGRMDGTGFDQRPIR